MTKKTQLLLWLAALGLLDAIIPFFPVIALFLAYVLVERPHWFLVWVQEIYRSN